jgi:hypothetical protein
MAAVFDDGSSEGDFHETQAIFDRRTGFARGLERINVLLSAPHSDVTSLRDQIASLPADVNPEINAGQEAAKQIALRALDPIVETIRQGGQGYRFPHSGDFDLEGDFSTPEAAVAGLLRHNQFLRDRLDKSRQGGQK